MERTITYRFDFEDGTSWVYQLDFDENQHVILSNKGELKPWTMLEYFKCPHCPLKESEHPQCPVARNIDRVVEDSKNTISIKVATVHVKTPEREYIKQCSTQQGLGSIFGLIMASSACPHLDWLRPLAHFHLPFSTIEETLFRVLSLQLITEFFKEATQPANRSAESVKRKYKSVETVNHAFIQRIRNYCTGDADKNALAALDLFVQLFELEKEGDFSLIRGIFE